MVLPDLPPRPTLRPGVHVVRRDATTLQIGVDPPERVLAPDTDGVRRFLAALREGRPPEPGSADALACLIDLLAAGLVVTADPVRPHAEASVGVRGPDPLAARAVAALTGAGVSAPRGLEPPAAWLVLNEGEPARAPGRRPGARGCAAPAGGLARRPAGGGTVRVTWPHRLSALRRRPPRRARPTTPPCGRADRAGGRRRSVRAPRRAAVAARPGVGRARSGPVRRGSPTVDLVDQLRGRTARSAATPRWGRHPHCGCSWDALLAY